MQFAHGDAVLSPLMVYRCVVGDAVIEKCRRKEEDEQAEAVVTLCHQCFNDTRPFNDAVMKNWAS